MLLDNNARISIREQFLICLKKKFGDREGSSILRLYAESNKGIFEPNVSSSKLECDLQLLIRDYPIQYLIGKAWFYNYQFLVNENVLIPRPETEELVDQILSDHSEDNLKVIDIGTGSGCIPITLKLNRQSWQIDGLDISKNALSLAKENINLFDADVRLLEVDILKEELSHQTYDIVVSNPPYIDYSEQKYMNNQVLLFEPKIALYASNGGLQFYERILSAGRDWLKPKGEIYFELNEFIAQEVVNTGVNFGFDVTVIKDMSNKNRIAHCKLV